MTYTPEDIQQNREKVLEAIISNPERHNQKQFGIDTECGTQMCIAGWACVLDENCQVFWDTNGLMVDHDGEVDGIQERAGELLGLNEMEQWSLFYDMDNASALLRLKHLVDTGVLPPKES